LTFEPREKRARKIPARRKKVRNRAFHDLDGTAGQSERWKERTIPGSTVLPGGSSRSIKFTFFAGALMQSFATPP
jgi:hypothetical protein